MKYLKIINNHANAKKSLLYEFLSGINIKLRLAKHSLI